MSTPRPYSIVVLEPNYKKWLIKNGKVDSPLLKSRSFVFLGEIPNMPTHCVVADIETGRVIVGYHSDDFIEDPDAQNYGSGGIVFRNCNYVILALLFGIPLIGLLVVLIQANFG